MIHDSATMFLARSTVTQTVPALKWRRNESPKPVVPRHWNATYYRALTPLLSTNLFLDFPLFLENKTQEKEGKNKHFLNQVFQQRSERKRFDFFEEIEHEKPGNITRKAGKVRTKRHSIRTAVNSAEIETRFHHTTLPA